MGAIDPNEPPLFDIDAIDEVDVEGDESKGGLTLEGVEIPFDLLEHGNGRLPDSALERIGIGGHRLHRSAAAAFARFREAAAGAGIDLTLTDSYRTFDQQVDLKKRKPGLSATPGKSVHGWGFAVDVSIGMPPKAFGQSVYTWLKDNGPGIGWHLGRPKDEPWHWVYRGPIAATGSAPASRQRRSRRPASSSSGRPAIGSPLSSSACGSPWTASSAQQTEAAVIAFQQSSGLTADGRVGPQTWAKLVRDDGARPTGPRFGSEARARPCGGCSNDSGSRPTATSARRPTVPSRRSRAANGLKADGVVGPKTWAVLAG